VATVKLSSRGLQLNQSQVTLGSAASLLAATLYLGNHDRNHKLWNIGSTERDILHINGKFTMRKLKSLSFFRCNSRYKADLAVFVLSFILSSFGIDAIN
jgi:hypothetical protein